MGFEKVKEALEKRGFCVSVFAAAKEAADYLNREIDGVSVGLGGSVTLKDMCLGESLAAHNEIYWHWAIPEGKTKADVLLAAQSADVYLLSVNGLAETGEIINIDGTGNRISAALYGHKKVYFVVGKNKIAPTYEEALHRARNIAAPKNCVRLGLKTPCAAKADKCYDCASPDRICCGLSVLWTKMLGADMEVVLIDEELGY
ncbi:MAG: lactate utilization protein [Oscillospiraceae bacterium]|nr:lactate utilization protein [Oscillospiraceae bacterium]